MSLPLLSHTLHSHKLPSVSALRVRTCPHTSNLRSSQLLQFPSSLPQNPARAYPSGKFLKLGFPLHRHSGFRASAGNGEQEIEPLNDKDEIGGQSTLPERFRYLTKEAPDKPVRWPWLIALFFLIYAWRTVAWELNNWKQALASIVKFVGWLLKLFVALIFHFIGDQIASTIRYIETFLYFARSFYFGIVAYAPVQELATIVTLTSAILAISEATVPNSINSQPYLLTFAGFLGYLVVRGHIPVALFWLLLLGIFSFSRFMKKRDVVSAALPVAATAAAIGEPWLRALMIAFYIGLAMFQHFKSKENSDASARPKNIQLPWPLLLVGLTIGIHVAAKWARYRHLTWMIA